MPASRPKPNRSQRTNQSQVAVEPEVVQPLWLVKAIGFTVLAALVCGYLALCLLFYQGQWQLVLHPSSAKSSSSELPTVFAGQPAEIIRFGTDDSARPQLVGWYIPAADGAPYISETVLLLPSGDGQLADARETLTMLHTLGVNVFAFDYRGYGMSLRANPGQSHPTESRMKQDAALAWQYLTNSRGLKVDQVVPFGIGVGAALAADLAASHPGTPALLIAEPRPDLFATVRRDPRSSLLPVVILFHERFEITQTLAALKTPKLLVLNKADKAAAAERNLAQGAADPKFILSLNQTSSPQSLPTALGRFLDESLHR